METTPKLSRHQKLIVFDYLNNYIIKYKFFSYKYKIFDVQITPYS